MVIMKVDKSGETLWTSQIRNYGTGGVSIKETINHNLIVVGREGPGGSTFFAKFSESGSLISSKLYPNSIPFEVDINTQDEFVISGSSGELFLIKTDSNGLSGCEINATFTLSNPIFKVTNGTPSATVPVSKVENPLTILGSGGSEKTICSNASISTNENNFIKIFPNPSSDFFTISFDASFSNQKLDIYSISGQKMYSKILSSNLESIDITNFSKGIYFIKVGLHSEKLIIE